MVSGKQVMTPIARQAADLTNEEPSFIAAETYMEDVMLNHTIEQRNPQQYIKR